MTVLKRVSDTPGPGEYIIARSTDHWATYRCPVCNGMITLSKRAHTVNYNGNVSPGVICPYKTNRCDFNSPVLLEGWIPEAKGSA